MTDTNNTIDKRKPKTYALAKLAIVFAIISILSILSIVIVLHIETILQILVLPMALLALAGTALATLFGIISLRAIRKSHKALGGLRYAKLALIISVISISFIVYGGVQLKRLIGQMICGNGLKGFGSALEIYTYEKNGEYPRADKWCDLLIQEVSTPPEKFVCPSSRAEKGQSSYVMNKNIVGMKTTDVPPDVVLLFESEPGWNQVGGPELLTIDNHKGYGFNGCNVLFNNTRVKFVKEKDFWKLQWEAKKGYDKTDIHSAIWYGEFSKVQSMLAENPELVHEKNIFERTSLHTAALAGHKHVAELLLSKGAKEDRDDKSETPMHLATRQGHAQIVELLLAAGMDADPKDSFRSTPLHRAALRGHKEVAELLIANGASINPRDNNKQTPLYYAEKWHDNKELANLLRKHGANE